MDKTLGKDAKAFVLPPAAAKAKGEALALAKEANEGADDDDVVVVDVAGGAKVLLVVLLLPNPPNVC